MPYRLHTIRTDPARSIVWVVSLATLVLQLMVLTPWISPAFWPVVPNVVIVSAMCVWSIWASWVCNIKHEAMSTFWLSALWLWSGLSRLLFSPDPTLLLWAPFIVVSLALGICYIYLSAHKKAVGSE